MYIVVSRVAAVVFSGDCLSSWSVPSLRHIFSTGANWFTVKLHIDRRLVHASLRPCVTILPCDSKSTQTAS